MFGKYLTFYINIFLILNFIKLHSFYKKKWQFCVITSSTMFTLPNLITNYSLVTISTMENANFKFENGVVFFEWTHDICDMFRKLPLIRKSLFCIDTWRVDGWQCHLYLSQVSKKCIGMQNKYYLFISSYYKTKIFYSQ